MAVVYTKNALVSSEGFTRMERDILKVALDDNKQYTVNVAKRIIKKFKEGI